MNGFEDIQREKLEITVRKKQRKKERIKDGQKNRGRGGGGKRNSIKKERRNMKSLTLCPPICSKRK
jgi:hypothetical protein